MPGSSALPPKTLANRGDITSSAVRPRTRAISSECASSTGAATGVGSTRDHAPPSTWRTRGPVSGSPGSSRRNVLSNRRSTGSPCSECHPMVPVRPTTAVDVPSEMPCGWLCCGLRPTGFHAMRTGPSASRIFTPMLLLACALAGATAAAADEAVPASTWTLVQAGSLLDRPAHAPRGASTVLIRDGRVVEVRDGHLGASSFGGVPEDAAVIDLRDRFVLPGLIDSHVHLTSDKAGVEGLVEGLTNGIPYFAYEAAVNARKTLHAGFTTVRNLGNADGVTLALRDAIAAGKIPGPRIIDSGLGISATSGHGDGTLGLNPEIASHMHET